MDMLDAKLKQSSQCTYHGSATAQQLSTPMAMTT